MPHPHCAQLTFFVRWICIESGLEVVVELFNYVASTNVAMGSPSSFYIAMALNVAMILLEWIEGRLTRCHGGKQTPWDRFLFGQVPHGQLRTQHTSTCHARALWCGEGTDLLRKRVDGTAWAAALPLLCRCPAAALPLPCRCPAAARALVL